jgi:5-methyltetrahydrofolate--homocysteine methyltransferase
LRLTNVAAAGKIGTHLFDAEGDKMNPIEELLQTEPFLLLDGGMGTMLFDQGLASGAAPEEWNISHPDRVRLVHRSYVEAGSRLVLTNSFGGTYFRLKLHNLQDRVYELNKAAAENARAEADLAGHLVLVGGSIGPTGELLEPMGKMTFEQAAAAFAEQARGLADGGVDVLWIETMSDLNEVKAAVAGARSVSNLPITATMSFDTQGRTMMGVTPAEALRELKALGLAAVGANCGNGLAEIIGVIEAMQAVDSDMLLIAKSNAGVPHWADSELSYDGTPELMASYANLVHRLGARLIGGCCGSSPAHIAAMARSLDYFAQTVKSKTAVTSNGTGRERRHRRVRR